MSFKIKKTIMFKEDPEKTGILFSLDSDNDTLIKVTDVAKEFVKMLFDGKSYEEARQEILDQYEVGPEVFDQDLKHLQQKLGEINFLEK